MRGLIIFGATSLAKLVHYYAVNDIGLRVLGFAVDEAYKDNDQFLSLPIFTWPELLEKFTIGEINLFVAVGYKNMRLREAAYAKVKSAGYDLINIVCTSSFVANSAAMGDNNIIMPGAVVEPDVRIGANNVVWSNSTICHDCTIGSHNFIAANSTIGGFASVGDQNFLGFSSVVLQGRNVGNETLIAAQSMVYRDTENLSEYRGAPAKRISSIDPNAGITIHDAR